MIQGAILFGLAILAIVIGAFALANKSTPSNTANESAKVSATALIKLAGDLASAAQRFSFDYDLATMTLDSSSTGLFDPAKGITGDIEVPAGVTTRSTSFIYSIEDFEVGGQGTSDSEYVIYVGSIIPQVCAQINHVLHGRSLSNNPPSSLGSNVEGCYSLDGNLRYYKVIKSN